MKFLKRNTGKLLIIAGILCIAAALLQKAAAANRQTELVDAYRKQIAGEIKQYREKGHKYKLSADKTNEEEQRKLSFDDTKVSDKTVALGDTVGILTIPKIDLTVTVSEGIEKEIIKYAAGHFPETALPGQNGNCAVIGHRNYTYGEYFNRLDELEIGDTVTIESGVYTYTYTVDEMKVVEPEEVSVLDPTEEATITLITCTPVRIATHRLIIKGHLTEAVLPELQ